MLDCCAEMAEGGGDLFSISLQKLDDELTCPVCTEHFKEPKVLPCLHYYCKTCIADLINRANGRPFNCPECRREAQVAGNNPERYVLIDRSMCCGKIIDLHKFFAPKTKPVGRVDFNCYRLER